MSHERPLHYPRPLAIYSVWELVQSLSHQKVFSGNGKEGDLLGYWHLVVFGEHQSRLWDLSQFEIVY